MREERTDVLFSSLGLAPRLLERLEALGFKHPTPIQHKTIPLGVEGQDVIGIAQTGTGKTLAFALPMLQRIARTKSFGLVLLPTRELAVQVHETFQKIAASFGLRTAMVIGGASMNMQAKQLKENPHVIIATPGRLIDHMNQKRVQLKHIGILVLDEADRMLDMGFAPQINRLLQEMPSERQTLLFSATMPSEIATIAQKYMKTPVRVEVSPQGTAAQTIEQEVYFVGKPEKPSLLQHILKEHRGSVLVFSRTKHGATKLARIVRSFGESATEIHSNRSQNQRQHALNGFASGQYRVLIATDIAARGIDVKNIALVVNYDLPDQTEDYVHRIGRTGRAGATGKAISFACPDQKRDVVSIERLIKKPLPKKSTPQLAPIALPVQSSYSQAPSTPSAPPRRGPRNTRGGYGSRGERGAEHSGYGNPYHPRGGRPSRPSRPPSRPSAPRSPSADFNTWEPI